MAYRASPAVAGEQVGASHLLERSLRRARSNDHASRVLLERLDRMLKAHFDTGKVPQSIQQDGFKFWLVEC